MKAPGKRGEKILNSENYTLNFFLASFLGKKITTKTYHHTLSEWKVYYSSCCLSIKLCLGTYIKPL